MLLSKHPLVLSLLLLITAASPVASAVQAFETRDELYDAVNSYCLGNPVDEATYGSIANWDVSKITSMYGLFTYMESCNPNIRSWDVSKVTNFGSMFASANAFNQDISTWDVSKGSNFAGMFWSAEAFNHDISNWVVSSGTNFLQMFYKARAFNQDISNWDVSSGNDFYWMFKNAEAFNQPLLYCKWQSNDIFKLTTPNPCDGSKSCGWGQPELCFSTAPSSSPPSSPTAKPFGSPVVSSSPTSSPCIDSPYKAKMKMAGDGSIILLSCADIDISLEDAAKTFCEPDGRLATHCPSSCGKCNGEMLVDSKARFLYTELKGPNKLRTCKWLNGIGKERCEKHCAKNEDLRMTCRASCTCPPA